MFEGLFSSQDTERVLLFLAARGEGYGKEIADFWQAHVSGIQRQLDRLEVAGILSQKLVGRTRVYSWNKRWPFRAELESLLKKAMAYLPKRDQEALTLQRRRPRRKDKPLSL